MKEIASIISMLIMFSTITTAGAFNDGDSIEAMSICSNSNEGTEYWAIFVSTNTTMIPSLYNAIITKDNWNESNIQLLQRSEATRENIIYALDWLQSNTDGNDIVLFSFTGHGTIQHGKYGISPWDRDYILIEELDEKFDAITCNQLCLVFDCCFSGSFIDNEPSHLSKNDRVGFKHSLTSGLEDENRVILMSTLKKGGGFVANILENDIEIDSICFSRFVADAFLYDEDENNDGWVSAEEAFRYGKKKFLPYAVIFFLLLPLQIQALIQSRGHLLLPFPTIYDAVEGDLPIANVNSSGSPYLNQVPPGKTPKRFFPEEYISDMQYEPIFLFTINGTKCYYTSTKGLSYTELIHGSWSEPFDLNIYGEYMDFAPNISPDGTIIFFNSIDRPIPDGYTHPRVPIFKSEGLNKSWTKPEYIGFGGMYACSSYNKSLYFTYTERGVDCIALRTYRDGEYHDIEIIPSPVYSHQYVDRHPFIAPDESYLIFDSENRPKYNGCSLFVTFKIENNSWTEPINLGKFIRQDNAALARITSDGKYLFYNDVNGYNYWVSTDIIKDLRNEILKQI